MFAATLLWIVVVIMLSQENKRNRYILVYKRSSFCMQSQYFVSRTLSRRTHDVNIQSVSARVTGSRGGRPLSTPLRFWEKKGIAGACFWPNCCLYYSVSNEILVLISVHNQIYLLIILARVNLCLNCRRGIKICHIQPGADWAAWLPDTCQVGLLVRRPGGPQRHMLKKGVEQRRRPMSPYLGRDGFILG